MHRALSITLLLLTVSGTAEGQFLSRTYTISQLPATCEPAGAAVVVTDGAGPSDCDTGGGSDIHTCYCNSAGTGFVASVVTLTRIVTVDQGGQGDFTTVAAACDFVATQTRSATEQWTIQIGPGQYLTEPNFTVPTFTHLQGIADVAADDIQVSGAPLISGTATSGTFITMSASTSLSNLTVGQTGTLTGARTMVQTTSTGRLLNVTFLIVSSSATHALVGFNSTGGSTVLAGVLFMQSSSGVANTTHTLVSGTGHSSIRYSWFHDNGFAVPYAIRNTGSGHILVWFTRMGDFTGSNYVTQLANDGAGTMYALATPYSTFSGTIQHPWQWREEDIVSTIARDSELHAEDHATRHSLGGADPVTATNLASACTDVQVLGGTAAGTGVECQADQTGTDDQVASEVPITDAGGFFTGTEVETALQEVGPTMADARQPADDSVDAAALADGDLGQVSVSGGVVTVEGTQRGTSFPVSPATGDVFQVEDDSATGACDSAAGSALSLCRWSGAAWVALGDGGQAAPSFDEITPGTNTTAAMVVGSGGSLKVSGTGTIDASGIDADGDGTRELSVTPGTSITFNPLDGSASGAWDADGLGIGTTNSTRLLEVVGSAGGAPYYSQVVVRPGVGNGDSAVTIESTRLSTTQRWFFGSGSGAGHNYFRIVDLTDGNTDALNVIPGTQEVVAKAGLTAEGTLKAAGKSVNSPSTATCADSGDANPGTVVITPSTSLTKITNSDIHGCDPTVSESGAVEGQLATIIVVSNAGGTVDFTDSAGVLNLNANLSLDVDDVLQLQYICTTTCATDGRWVQTAPLSNN